VALEFAGQLDAWLESDWQAREAEVDPDQCDPFELGLADQRLGVPRADNPYLPRSRAGRAWLEAWDHAAELEGEA
jgi:hypothetical protein